MHCLTSQRVLVAPQAMLCDYEYYRQASRVNVEILSRFIFNPLVNKVELIRRNFEVILWLDCVQITIFLFF